MKKIFAFVSTVALLVSCTKEAADNDPIVPEVKLVPITVTAGVDTKATIGEMQWEEGDKITVWVESDIENPTFKGYELDIVDPATGEFSGEIVAPQESDTYYAAYGATGFDKANKTPVFAIAAEQNNAAGGATKVMLGGKFTGAKKDVAFTMNAATAKLSITVNEDVKAVEFAGMNGEIIAQGNATAISYNGAAARNVQLIVPAIEFSKGYKVTYTNTADEIMYQAYSTSSGVTFTAGKERIINCTFVPFNISCAIDAENAPKTSYDYYLAGNLTKANSADFETVGRLSGGQTENPWQYDEDAQGIFSGKIERGKAKIVINGASSKVIPANLTIKEYGCYVKRVGGQEGKDVYATAQSIDLTKDFSWDVLYKKGEAATHMIEVDAGDLELKPYIIVNDGAADAEYVAPTAYTLHVTGLPHRSDHKDLWYVCTQGSGSNQVSGKVERHPDENEERIDMFYADKTGGWRDYCVRTRHFNIPAETNAKVIMHGTLWAPHSISAYFWFDATNNSFVFHKDASKGSEKLTDNTQCGAYEEESEARQNKAYYDLGTTHGHVNNNTITLSPEKPAANVYLWMHRGTTIAIDYVGYWCRYIKVQYAAKPITPIG